MAEQKCTNEFCEHEHSALPEKAALLAAIRQAATTALNSVYGTDDRHEVHGPTHRGQRGQRDAAPVDGRPVTAPAPDEGLRAAVRKAITDAYYDARNARQTMETAADNATTAVLAVLAAVGPDSTGGQGESVTEWGVRGLSKGEPAVWTYRSRRDAEKSRATSEVLVSRTRYADTVTPWVPVEEANHG